MTAAPAPVEIAFRLWCASAVASVLASVLSVPIVGELDAARGVRPPPGLDPAQAQSTLLAGGIIGAALVAVVSVVVVLIAARMRAGTGWARTVLAVLGAGIVVGGVLTIGTTFAYFRLGLLAAVVGVLMLASLGLVAAAASFMYRPPAGAYFAERRTGPT